MTKNPLLAVRGLGYDIGTRTLWDGITLSVVAGDALALRGPSGQGKSTLLGCLSGTARPSRGTVVIDGVDVGSVSPRLRRRLRRDIVGIVPQDHAVVPEWTVAQNLRVVRLAGVERSVVDARIREALLMVGLGGRLQARAGRLSGGEQQRVAVARVLVQRPRVVLADEPTASLDEASAARVRLGLDALRSTGSAVVVATHDPALIDWVDRCLDLETAGR